MKSQVTRSFWKLFEVLPRHIQVEAKNLHLVWRRNPSHPSLHFKKVGVSEGFPIWSIRIGRKWRALGVMEGDTSSGSGSAPTKPIMRSSSGYELKVWPFSWLPDEAC